jgi:hypothetical protein
LPISAGVLSANFVPAPVSRETRSIPWILESFVAISSAMPSLKYALSGSVLRFFSGRTAMEGRLGVALPLLRNHNRPATASSNSNVAPAIYGKLRCSGLLEIAWALGS